MDSMITINPQSLTSKGKEYIPRSLKKIVQRKAFAPRVRPEFCGGAMSYEDVALAPVSVIMRPIPFAPIVEELSLTDLKYGSVKRIYVETPEDNAIPISLQESMIERSPPERVFSLIGADHSPFFSKLQALLHKRLVEISKIK